MLHMMQRMYSTCLNMKSLKDKVEGKGQVSSSSSHRLFKRARTTVETILFSNHDVDEFCKVLDRFRMIPKDIGFLMNLITLKQTVCLKVDEMM